jgi:hypothetical protein
MKKDEAKPGKVVASDTIQTVIVARDKEELRMDLSHRLDIVNKKALHYRKLNTFLTVVALTLGLLAAALAGDSSSKGGGIIAQRIAIATTSEGSTDSMEGWRNVYFIIAVLSFFATVATGLNTSLKIAEHQTKSVVCAGTLDGLLLETQGAKTSERLDKVRDDFQKLLIDYAEYTR